MAFDSPDSESYRFLGKMLTSSLVRTFFTGDILVFRNSAARLFLVERKGLDEMYLETPAMSGMAGAERAWCWKHKVAELIGNPEEYDKILFLDSDSLAPQNIDHLLEGDWDICYQPERDKPGNGRSFNAFLTEAELEQAVQREGANSGTNAVRGSRFHEVMRQWEEIDESDPVRNTGFRDQASWNALLLRELVKKELTIEPFPIGEVQFPGYPRPNVSEIQQSRPHPQHPAGHAGENQVHLRPLHAHLFLRPHGAVFLHAGDVTAGVRETLILKVLRPIARGA